MFTEQNCSCCDRIFEESKLYSFSNFCNAKNGPDRTVYLCEDCIRDHLRLSEGEFPSDYQSTENAIKDRGMTQMPAILKTTVIHAKEVGCFKDDAGLITFVTKTLEQYYMENSNG